MTLKRAIEIVTMATGGGGIATQDDYIDAQKLLIEAGKGFQKLRKVLEPYVTLPLPGETEE